MLFYALDEARESIVYKIVFQPAFRCWENSLASEAYLVGLSRHSSLLFLATVAVFIRKSGSVKKQKQPQYFIRNSQSFICIYMFRSKK